MDTNHISYFLKLAHLFSFEREADVVIGIFTFSHELQTSLHCFTTYMQMHFEKFHGSCWNEVSWKTDANITKRPSILQHQNKAALQGDTHEKFQSKHVRQAM